MKVFYTAAKQGKKRYQEFYDLVLETIHQFTDDVISPELGNYLKVLPEKEKLKIRDLHKIHYKAIRRGIELADIVIIEISEENFQLGHEATLAVLNKKPVLCLSIHENMSVKIDSPYFYGAKYNEDNVYEIVGDFLRRFSKNILNQRFNMFLSSTQLAYLDQASKEKNISASAYVRWLIDRDRGNR